MAKMNSIKLGEIKKVEIEYKKSNLGTDYEAKKIRILKYLPTKEYQVWVQTNKGWTIPYGGTLAQCRKFIKENYITE